MDTAESLNNLTAKFDEDNGVSDFDFPDNITGLCFSDN